MPHTPYSFPSLGSRAFLRCQCRQFPHSFTGFGTQCLGRGGSGSFVPFSGPHGITRTAEYPRTFPFISLYRR